MAKGGNAGTDRVKELTAKGFTKTKVTQALKDAGNNYQVALRILESQRDQAASTAALTAGQAGRSTAQCGPVASRAAPTSAPAPSRDAVRRHPCLVQYKSCQYGQYCRLKDYPGDTCIQYFHGCCVFGDACKHRHFIDGVDIREGLRPEKADALTTKDGTFRILTGSDGKLQFAERVFDEADLDTDVSAQRFTYVPQEADFNRVRGAEPTHTDPYAAPLGVAAASAAPRPTPFLDSLRRGLEAVPARAAVPPVAPVRVTAAPLHADGRRAPPASRKKHPCVAQFGFCKFGDLCHHADRDADVCVHFLNGRCKFTDETCRYRHESEETYMRGLMARLDAEEQCADSGVESGADEGEPYVEFYQGEQSQSELDMEPCQGSPFTAKPKARLQNFDVAPAAPHGLFPSSSSTQLTGALGNGAMFSTEMEAALPARREPNPYLVTEAQRRPFTVSEFLPRELMTYDDEESFYDGDEEEAEDRWPEDTPHGGLGNPQNDRELETLLRLMEVFPTADPLVVMQALRSCGQDATAAAEMLTRVTAVESRAEGVDEVLAQALAEEEAGAADKTAREAAARCEALLTLCVLFPKVEPAGIEAVLQRCQGDFHDAYGVLLCAQENVSRRAYGHFWNGRINPAESLKVARLEGMFPEIHPDIVRSTFGNCDNNVTKSIDALNQLTTELLSLETRASLGEEATRWRPHVVLARPFPLAGSADVACPVETSEELSEAYREAERECRELGDWRRVRERAYLVNTARIRMLALASAAFANDEGRVAKLLSREGKDLGREYARLNRLAMLALERERLTTQPTSTLDVHDFHVPEAVEVLYRRVDLCRKKGIRRLTVIVGEGKHSRREGHSSIYPVLLQKIREDPYFKRNVHITSVKPSFLELTVRFAE